MLNSTKHGPLVYGTIKVDGVTRTKTYKELTDAEKLQDDCDVIATNIILQVLQTTYPSPAMSKQPQAEFPQLDSGLAVLSFLPEHLPIQETKQPFKMAGLHSNKCRGGQGQSFAGMGTKSNATSSMINRNGGNNAAVQARVVRCYNCQGEGHMARQCTQLKRPRNSAWFKEKILLVQAQEAGQTDDLDAFDSYCDEAPCAKAVLMANLSSYDSPVISENVNESLAAELERYKEQVRIFEERQKVDLNDHEKFIESQINDMIHNKNAKFSTFQKEIDTMKFSLSKLIKENESLMTTIAVLKKQTKEKEDKYIVETIDLEKQKKELENIVFKVGQFAQTMHMLTKIQVFYDDTHKQARGYQNPFYLKKAQRIKPTLYDGTMISRKHDVIFVVDSEETLILAEENFDNGLHNEINEVKTVFNQMEDVVEQYSVDKKCFEMQKKELLLENDRLLELIISQDLMYTAVNSLKVIDECESLRKDYCEEYNRNLTLEAELSKMNELSKKYSRLQNHCISLELKLQQNKERFQNNSNLDDLALNENFVINDLKAQLQAKASSISKLRAHIATIKGKNVSENNVHVNNAYVIALGMFKLDLEPLSYRLKNNREAHEDYIQNTKEHTDTLRRVVEQARKQHPRVIASTSASGSQSKNDTKKNRITPAASSNKKNKAVEVHPRKVMSSSNKRNHVSLCNTNFKHVVKDVNSKFVCSTCNGCLFSSNPDKCVVTYINDVNKRAKSESDKSKQMEWKPTSKVFTSVRHMWLLIGGTFIINGAKCLMTRITSNPIVPCIDVIDEILEEDFNALFDEGSEIFHSIEVTILKEKLFVEFDDFMAMTADENSESDTKEPPFEKITFNTDYKIKTSLEEPHTDLKLKPLPDNLEYAFLEEPSFLSVIISS
uniref:Reverse transcriptase domain-containing protein n=1 Tax=Tanacetum cinerariifolium TaxID=118510 RepID=A0A6L2MTW0_TANCI|nr:reverse transcriptase domain-containing protein [Tanacetum cinerariifolium]